MSMVLRLEPNPTPWDLKWTMFRTPVRVHPLFWLFTLFLAYGDGKAPFQFTLVTVLCVFISILVHEFGHALCRRYYGDRNNYVVLYSLGGLSVSGGTEPPGHMPRIWMLLWGPGAGFILGGMAFGIQLLIEHQILPLYNAYAWHALSVLVWVNMIWGCINLLPVFPLDGGQIMREIVIWKMPQRGDPFVFTVSFISALLVSVAAGVLIAVYGDRNLVYPLIFFALLAYQSWSIKRQLGQYGSLDGGGDERREAWEQDPDWWKRGR
jgi:stage IV sporulation protein FB